jgi:hypothetical protein
MNPLSCAIVTLGMVAAVVTGCTTTTGCRAASTR